MIQILKNKLINYCNELSIPLQELSMLVSFSGGVDNPVLSDTTVGAAMGSQVHMRAGRRGPQNVVSATAF